MIRALVDKISQAVQATDGQENETREDVLRLCTAVLMVEVARADYDFDESEFDLLLELIKVHFGLSAEDATQLANEAAEVAEDSVSLHEFTQRLHKHLSEREKAEVVSLLWQVAYADGSLDKFEDSIVLKISDLLYVSRGKVMQLKHDAEVAKSA
ncbi:MAG: TerB family tellurite resistance protein [Pseudomonadota bacterium]